MRGVSSHVGQPGKRETLNAKHALCAPTHPSRDCSAQNVARTCSTFPPEGKCSGLDHYPNVTIDDYGSISGKNALVRHFVSECGAVPVSSIELLRELLMYPPHFRVRMIYALSFLLQCQLLDCILNYCHYQPLPCT